MFSILMHVRVQLIFKMGNKTVPVTIPVTVPTASRKFWKIIYLFLWICHSTKIFFPNVLKDYSCIKKCDTYDVENYRHKTIINNFSKVFEMVLYKGIYNHVTHLISGYMSNIFKITNIFCMITTVKHE